MEKTRLLNVSKPLAKVTIRQYLKPDGERFNTAIVLGWNGFKFISKTLKAQQLYEKTILECENILSKLQSCNTIDEQLKAVEKLNNIYILT